MAYAITARSPVPARIRVASLNLSMAWVDGCVLVALLIAAPLLYLPLLRHNLPVAMGIDERNALVVLARFHHGSLDPGFFQYPTLSFYAVYVLMLPLKYSNTNVMLVGRMLDLVLIGVIAFLVYVFCRDRLHSRAAGVIGALLVLGSTELAGIVYLHPDLLMTAAGMASLYYLVDYFDTRSRRSWVLGLTLMGIAFGCKYTALIFYAAYAATEMLASLRERHVSADQRVAGPRFSRNACVTALLAVGVASLLASWLIPWQAVLALLLKSRAGYEVGPGAFYVEVFGHLRRMLAELGLLSLGLGLLCRYVRDVYEAIAIKRLYYGLGVIALVSVVCTPYIVIRPAHFVFDLGALTRITVIVPAGSPQWGAYASWLLRDEGAVLVLGLVGLAMFATKVNRRFQILLVYLAIYLSVLGISKIGYSRYLLPVIVLFAVGTGWASVRLWRIRPVEGSRGSAVGHLRRVVVVLLLAGALVQMTVKIAAVRQDARGTNSFFASYTAAKAATTGTAFYAGYAPATELEEAGVRTMQLSFESMSGTPLGQHLACGDTLILSTATAEENHVDARRDSSVTMLVDAAGTGHEAQQVLRKRGCP